ncbi:MAG TPA: HlyD family secretion protein [Mucilaginibacter sp.]|nr:HlyD family secretion protein [Mucilaginibacter sp.]
MPAILTEENDPETRHSDEVQDIITKVPSWLLRWGITLFFGILLLIILLSALIRYPDVVNAQLKIVSLDPAKPILSAAAGKIDKLLVSSHKIVKMGDPLAFVSAPEKKNGEYLISAPMSGRVSYGGVMEKGLAFDANQVLFYIIPEKEEYFGEMIISQNNMSKVKEGQQVLIRLKSYPFEEYGMLRGSIKYISEVPNKDSVFIAEVDLKTVRLSDQKRPIGLKQGMTADAAIITQDATIMQRIARSFFKITGNK